MMWFLGELVVFWRACGFCRLCGFLPSLWFLPGLWFFAEFVVFAVFVVFSVFVVFAVFVVFGRDCGSPSQSRDKGQTAKEFDATVEVVLVTRIGGCYGYD